MTHESGLPPRQHDFGSVPFDFLKSEIDLGLTFVRVAKTELSDDPEHSARVLGKARKALETVRAFPVQARNGI